MVNPKFRFNHFLRENNFNSCRNYDGRYWLSLDLFTYHCIFFIGSTVGTDLH